MRDETERAQINHTLTIENRGRAVVGGVSDVGMFNDQLVELTTGAGTLTIMGSELKISELNIGNGQLLVEGRIDALEYDDRAKRRGVGRLFK